VGFDIDAARADAEAFAGEETKEVPLEIRDRRRSYPVAVEERSETSEGETRADGAGSGTEEAGSAGVPTPAENPSADQGQQSDSVPETERPRSARSVTFLNGAKFYLGELIPWKGIQFQVIGMKGQSIVLHAIDLTGSERKRLQREARRA
jgi:hypothetical protein